MPDFKGSVQEILAQAPVVSLLLCPLKIRPHAHSVQPPMKQFVLFGDSITQGSFNQERGFAVGAQLSHGNTPRSLSLSG